MRSDQPRHWGQHITRAALLVLGLALLGRVVYELLTPLVPAALVLLLLGSVVILATRPGRR